ncbi:hypothetical protein AGMMS49965_17120 [Bacteroidia bacterium]|nr:hypothetical protein AGMMS49965_17120 [Bacteroidia bacterium]
MDMTKKGYRLPTEAEWEFAARGRNQSDEAQWNFPYSGHNNIDVVAWYYNNAGASNTNIPESAKGAHPVGLKDPNRGIYDMSGNVREWCWDLYQPIITTNTPAQGPTGSWYTERVCRGGGWIDAPAACRVISREGHYKPDYLDWAIGFRWARTL